MTLVEQYPLPCIAGCQVMSGFEIDKDGAKSADASSAALTVLVHQELNMFDVSSMQAAQDL